MDTDNGISTQTAERCMEATRRFLERKGYEILGTDYACGAGVADVIALDDGALCFIGVQASSGTEEGLPVEDVTPQRREVWERVAICYLAEHAANPGLDNVSVRFDLISVIAVSESRMFLRHHVNALA